MQFFHFYCLHYGFFVAQLSHTLLISCATVPAAWLIIIIAGTRKKKL